MIGEDERAQAGREAHGKYVRALLRDLGCEVEPVGLELLRLVRMVANQYEAIAAERLRAADLSAPRLGLLMRIMAEETYGAEALGTSPTHLSRCQHVSKNTISALLRGLEEQGLIERTLDPEDRRGFFVRVSEAGRGLVQTTAPGHLAYLNDLVADLTPDEQERLARLMGKLHESLARHGEGINGAVNASIPATGPVTR